MTHLHDDLTKRVGKLDWRTAQQTLDTLGAADLGPVLDPAECRHLSNLYDDASRYRSTINMARYRFGQGQYRYFSSPLPDVVAELRAAFWPHCSPSRGTGPNASGDPRHGPTPSTPGSTCVTTPASSALPR